MAKFKPCPFCNMNTQQMHQTANLGCWVQCGWCRAAGPNQPHIPDARKAWNKRPTSTPE